ncbi:hypothetical protein [Enterococcus gilvus]|uniref:hypothetical protein n=1 Tax=Enterococcus gilvus TaxID=160453 RepID=UPI0028D2C194|nr:hypothetical protein [Enterococcus gilvus]
MKTKILGCVVTEVSKDKIQVKEIHLGEKMVIETNEADAYSPGDLITINKETSAPIDRMEDYPFV